MGLPEMEAAGQLEPLAATNSEINALLSAAQRWLADARVAAVSNQGRFECAYNAVLNCALAALRANDYRVDAREGKHVFAIESLRFTIGCSPSLLLQLQKMRQRRNLDLYAGERPVSEKERDLALSTAAALVEQTRDYISQLRLDFRDPAS